MGKSCATRDLAEVTRGYGFLPSLETAMAPVRIVQPHDEAPGVARQIRGGGLLRQARRGWGAWLRGQLVTHYAPKLQYSCFSGPDVEPVWETEDGHAVVGWWRRPGDSVLLVGLDIAGEIVRTRQGDPARADGTHDRSGYGFEFERPNHLFQHQLTVGYETVPFADVLGFWWVETLSRLTGVPLVEPLPHGARGAVLLTGDDDQADLDRYARQQEVIGDFPITYYLHPLTKHTPATLAALPGAVAYGVHVDALDTPDHYAGLCRAQCLQIRELCGQAARTVRNHGYLNDGYLGHLPAWEADNLRLDVNFPGVDGTALTGSFLPLRVRRPDGSWSAHYSLLTAFGDGMVYALQMSERDAVARIRALTRQIERGHPGMLVFNLHPQNILDTEAIHREVLSVGRRRGWIAQTAEACLDWIEHRDALAADLDREAVTLTSERSIGGVTLRRPTRFGWSREVLTPWTGARRVGLGSRTAS